MKKIIKIIKLDEDIETTTNIQNFSKNLTKTYLSCEYNLEENNKLLKKKQFKKKIKKQQLLKQQLLLKKQLLKKQLLKKQLLKKQLLKKQQLLKQSEPPWWAFKKKLKKNQQKEIKKYKTNKKFIIKLFKFLNYWKNDKQLIITYIN